MIHSKQRRGCRIRAPGTCGNHQTKNKSLVYQKGGCKVQNSGPWDPWLPVVENSRRFALRGHSARCAPINPVSRPALQIRVVETRPQV